MPFGYQVFVDDGSGEVQVFVCASTGIDVSGLAVGQRVRVIGFSGQFADHYEINPRVPGDISRCDPYLAALSPMPAYRQI